MDYRNERDALRGRVENLEQDLAAAKQERRAADGGAKVARVAQLEQHLAEAQRLMQDVQRELEEVKREPEPTSHPEPSGAEARPSAASSSRGVASVLSVLAIMVLLVAVGIHRDWFTHADYFNDATSIPKKLSAKIDGPVRVRMVTILGDKVVALVEDANHPENVDSYVLDDGSVDDGTPQQSRAGESMPVAAVNFAAVPKMIAEAKRRLAIPDGEVTNMSFSCDRAPSWHVIVSSPRLSGSVELDGAGRVVAVTGSDGTRTVVPQR
jgi:hypothetical protein